MDLVQNIVHRLPHLLIVIGLEIIEHQLGDDQADHEQDDDRDGCAEEKPIDVDLVERQAREFQCLWNCVNRADAHFFGQASGSCE